MIAFFFRHDAFSKSNNYSLEYIYHLNYMICILACQLDGFAEIKC